jgi:hypothetical protein
LQSLYNKSPDIPQYKQKPARETYQLQRQAWLFLNQKRDKDPSAPISEW